MVLEHLVVVHEDLTICGDPVTGLDFCLDIHDTVGRLCVHIQVLPGDCVDGQIERLWLHSFHLREFLHFSLPWCPERRKMTCTFSL